MSTTDISIEAHVAKRIDEVDIVIKEFILGLNASPDAAEISCTHDALINLDLVEN